jgi:hypothetical protein
VLGQRRELYSVFHAEIFRRASNRCQNQLVFRHSSHSLPLKLSRPRFCVGFAWLDMNHIDLPLDGSGQVQRSQSGLLPQRIDCGLPYPAMARTRHCRVKPSMNTEHAMLTACALHAQADFAIHALKGL